MNVGGLLMNQQLTLASQTTVEGKGPRDQTGIVAENPYPVKGEKGPQTANHGDLGRDLTKGSVKPGPWYSMMSTQLCLQRTMATDVSTTKDHWSTDDMCSWTKIGL